MRYLKTHLSIKVFCAVLMHLLVSNAGFSQNMGGYQFTINTLNTSNTPITKKQIVSAIGNPDKYEKAEYPDEPFGPDEWYEYYDANGDIELFMKFSDGVLNHLYTGSSNYLFFGNVRIGDNIQKLRDMIANGFGSFYMEEDRSTGHKTIVMYLGYDELRVTHKDNTITFIQYIALF